LPTQVIRCQHPVGQGGFHTSEIRIRSSRTEKFTIVYDCGATQNDALQQSIDWYVNNYEKIDLLVLSHLDNDHVQGLDQLLTHISVDTVLIPYIDQQVNLADIFRIEAETGTNLNHIEACLEPDVWFGKRGVGRVIRARGNSDDDMRAPEEPPRDAGERDELGFSLKVDKNKLKQVRKQKSAQAELSDLAPGSCLGISHPSSSIDWVLIPYVSSEPSVKLADFQREVRAILFGSKTTKRRIRSEDLATSLKDRRQRMRLKRAYGRFKPSRARSTHNHVSMSLYSGPMSPFNPATPKFQTFLLTHWPHSNLDACPVGWLATGDAPFRNEAYRTKWMHYYHRYLQNISTLVLSHHGSRLDFHRDLVCATSAYNFVANASDPPQYRGHASDEIHDYVESHGANFIHVSQYPESEFLEIIQKL
jgi:hypothetical protein|tara:strand:+ start:18380 stop:19636 length:1257 start_codon:yes stop_codon:yes gene_type:complete